MALAVLGCAPSADHKVEEVAAKKIALTYDDAPQGNGPIYTGAERTRALIDQLSEAQTGPVAIFVTTRGLDKDEGRERIAAYAQAGHLIANHSDQHMWASRTSVEDYTADIDRAELKLKEFENRRPWFRFPYLDEGGMGEANRDGVKRDALRAALEARGLMSGYVTIDTYDWHLQSLWTAAKRKDVAVDMQRLSQLYTNMVLDAVNHYDALGQEVLGRRAPQVLLLHENDLAAHFTRDAVKALRQDGWQIISPDEAFDDPIATQLPRTQFSGMGRISALAADAGLRGRDVYSHWSASEAEIEARAAAMGLFTD